MCGIAGIASQDDPREQKRAVGEMCDLLRHRGPDDQGTYQGDGVVLGQQRLGIIDLAGGHQPMSNEAGDIWITLNGEIYNYKELREELQSNGHRFSTTTDTEVIVHLYEESGIELLDKLNGMFAFALWDAKERILYLVRDRLGVKPLYYSIANGRLTFASELKAILRTPELSRTLDEDAIAEYMSLGYIPPPRTPFRDIKKLPPGTYLRLHKGRLESRQYWRTPIQTGDKIRSLSDMCEQIRFLVEDSTRLQLRADVPVGVFASGGIDSTLIMWAASRQDSSLQAFVMEFQNLAADTPYARIAAEATGMKLREQYVSCWDAVQLLPKLVWHLDEPLSDPAVIPCYLIAETAAKAVKVILNGTGGDELFGGYHRYFVRGLLPDGSAGIANGLHRFAGSVPGADRLHAFLSYRERYLRRLYQFPECEVRASLGLTGPDTVRNRVDELFAEACHSDAPASMMFVDLNLYLPSDLFMLLDKMTMAVSLEARVPLLDHRLVEFAAALPGNLRMHHKELKWLLRQAFRNEIPDAILDRPKQGFGPPIQTWLNGDFGTSCRRLLTSKKARIANLFDPDQIVEWIDRASQKSATRIWSLIVLELWWRTFVDSVDLSPCDFADIVWSAA